MLIKSKKIQAEQFQAPKGQKLGLAQLTATQLLQKTALSGI